MKHAGQAALDALEDLLTEIRALGHLKEKTRGVFYYKSHAFLHFHEDPEGVFADLRVEGDWQRYAVNTPNEKRHFLARTKAAL